MLFTSTCRADSLVLIANIEKPSYDKGETVIIEGFVQDTSGMGVSYATVSIEVTGPTGGHVHVAMTLSGSDGSFSDEFSVPEEITEGTYTVYLIASKVGYGDVNLTTNYTVIPEFGFNGASMTILTTAIILTFVLLNSRASGGRFSRADSINIL
jgi:hypothetical protein